ncbi:hypothetical protein BHQ23_32505 [Mycobacterium gordonae]|nr:hypothetical protein BHQ23_32505 [Mycobacterium gordonae]
MSALLADSRNGRVVCPFTAGPADTADAAVTGRAGRAGARSGTAQACRTPGTAGATLSARLSGD